MVEVVDAVDVGAQKGGSTGGGERRSKRARKLRQPVHLSSTTTLHQLKLHLFEVFNVHPKNAQVYTAQNVLLQGDDLSLAQLEVFPEEELRLVSTGEHDDNDISDLFDTSTRHAERRGKGRELEAGFKNTALSLYEDDS
uniref:Ubiquitin-like domain-containing protein n=2 Tax=Dunaliella tertiolecta TaxID=3047 RepID=A0A7S3R0Y4_DUNTE